MKVSYELNLNNFEAWSTAEDTLNRILNEGREKELEMLLEELYPEGMDETQLNDLLRFDSEWIYETLGMDTENSLNKKIEETEEDMQNLMDDFEYDLEEENIIEKNKKEEYWIENYKEDYEDLVNELSELKCRLEELY